jgi:hypothetical protein
MRKELNKAEWGPFLERLSTFLSGSGAAGGKGSLFVVRPAVLSAPIIGVTYDPKDDEVDVAFEAHDHLVHKPVQIFIDEAADGVTALEVVDAEGTRHVLEPYTPLPVLAEAAKKGG